MAVKRESKFRSELKKSFEAFGCFPIILYDHAFTTSTKFQHHRPFDMIIFGNKVVAALELKVSTTKRFYFNRIEDHQLQYLYQVYSSGFEGYIVVNFKSKTRDHNLCFFIPIKDVLAAIGEEKKGFSIKDCEENFINCDRVKIGRTYGWEVPSKFYE